MLKLTLTAKLPSQLGCGLREVRATLVQHSRVVLRMSHIGFWSPWKNPVILYESLSGVERPTTQTWGQTYESLHWNISTVYNRKWEKTSCDSSVAEWVEVRTSVFYCALAHLWLLSLSWYRGVVHLFICQRSRVLWIMHHGIRALTRSLNGTILIMVVNSRLW